MGAVIAEPEAKGRELLGDLEAGEGRGERDVGVAAVVTQPLAVQLDRVRSRPGGRSAAAARRRRARRVAGTCRAR